MKFDSGENLLMFISTAKMMMMMMMMILNDFVYALN